MKIIELLNEEPVESTWITDLTYNSPNRTLTMRVSNGRIFSIFDISEEMYERWLNSPSKGFFFHNYIKNKYNIERID